MVSPHMGKARRVIWHLVAWSEPLRCYYVVHDAVFGFSVLAFQSFMIHWRIKLSKHVFVAGDLAWLWCEMNQALIYCYGSLAGHVRLCLEGRVKPDWGVEQPRRFGEWSGSLNVSRMDLDWCDYFDTAYICEKDSIMIFSAIAKLVNYSWPQSPRPLSFEL